MNKISVIIVLSAFLFSGWQQLNPAPHQEGPSPMEKLSGTMVESEIGTVELAIGLVGVMILFLWG
jgi:hypothetical protein